MHSEIPPHEKIRFHRSDIASLDSLPSAIVLPRPARLSAATGRAARITAAIVLGICASLIIAIVVIIAGLGDEQLRREAQRMMAAMVQQDQQVDIGHVGVSLDGLNGLVLQVDDLVIASAGGDVVGTHAGSLRIGLDILPLLSGRIRPRSLRVTDARIHLAALPAAPTGTGFAIFDEGGLVDPDRVAAVTFDAVRYLAAQLGARGIRRISVENLAVALSDEETESFMIEQATLRRSAANGLRLTASIEALGRVVSLRGEATLDTASDLVTELGLYVDMPAGTGAEKSVALANVGAATLLLSGVEGAENADRLTLSGRFKDADIPVNERARDRIIADIDVAVTAQSGTGKVEVERLHVGVGRSNWTFHGAFGPMPRNDDAAGEPNYRFELVSDGSTVSPEGSPEPTMAVTARIAGHLSADARLLEVKEIGVRSQQGEAQGQATMRLEPGKSPGLDLRIDVGEISVSHAKQLWPWFAAVGARNWVMANLFGGHVQGGWVGLSVPPGRLGNGVPLGPDEVSGLFAVRGTRFDVAGRIPPVRDGDGSVAFFGSDVDISLDSGVVFLPSGRTVAASQGTLAIRKAHIRPVIGKLDIQVAGGADAVLELASYEPIDVSRFIDILPDEMSGTVSGNVKADIPFHRDIAPEMLDWKVAFSYDDLTIARPIGDQKVSNAAGTIVVDPRKAIIDAQARLNDLPARLQLVEPLGKSTEQREQRILVEMDDKVRNAVAPGLDAILSGIARVEVDATTSGGRAVDVDLKTATLMLPWVGWSKGAGVPATASFNMTTDNGRTELKNFSLRGESFAASGAITLRGNGVERIRFSPMRLNRGDDFSVDVERKGKGYNVAIRGKSLDARSMIKLISRDFAEAAPSNNDVPISIDLAVDALIGFHGEVLRNVRLNYAGAGARTDRAQFSAVTASGAQLVFRDGHEGAARSVSMQTPDAGALLRFLDIYERMEQGSLALALGGGADGVLRGQVDVRNFYLVDEPRLSSLVSSPSTQDGRSLNQAVRGSLDTSRVQFERGSAQIINTPGTLILERGILRGPLIGVSFQGTLYDRAGNMAMTGTFMPAYGLNRIFGEIPLIGQILGNGRDRGLIGITFRLAGKADAPKLEINPLSVIAPGIFRSVFEFR